MALSRVRAQRLGTYLSGCAVFAAGATLFIHSSYGVDPLDTLALGMLEHLPITIGIAQASVAVVCIAIWSVWNRRRPVVSPFVTFFLCGSLIDLMRLADTSVIPAPAQLALGVVLCAYGSALIIMSGTGIRAMDLIVLTMTGRWRWPFWVAKASVEAVLLVVGYLLGGPVGVGTLCFLVFVDGLIQPFMILNQRLLGMENRGLTVAASFPTPAAAPQHS